MVLLTQSMFTSSRSDDTPDKTLHHENGVIATANVTFRSHVSSTVIITHTLISQTFTYTHCRHTGYVPVIITHTLISQIFTYTHCRHTGYVPVIITHTLISQIFTYTHCRYTGYVPVIFRNPK